jgi:hypothetical protein
MALRMLAKSILKPVCKSQFVLQSSRLRDNKKLYGPVAQYNMHLPNAKEPSQEAAAHSAISSNVNFSSDRQYPVQMCRWVIGAGKECKIRQLLLL